MSLEWLVMSGGAGGPKQGVGYLRATPTPRHAQLSEAPSASRGST